METLDADVRAKAKVAFMRKFIAIEGDCWHWIGKLHEDTGYGSWQFNGYKKSAHRWAYLLFKGDIPDGLDIDHTCRHRWCVNPDHLEAVTRQENLWRSPIWLGNKTKYGKTCPQGHPMIEENIMRRKNGNYKHVQCKICIALANAQKRWKNMPLEKVERYRERLNIKLQTKLEALLAKQQLLVKADQLGTPQKLPHAMSLTATKNTVSAAKRARDFFAQAGIIL